MPGQSDGVGWEEGKCTYFGAVELPVSDEAQAKMMPTVPKWAFLAKKIMCQKITQRQRDDSSFTCAMCCSTRWSVYGGSSASADVTDQSFHLHTHSHKHMHWQKIWRHKGTRNKKWQDWCQSPRSFEPPNILSDHAPTSPRTRFSQVFYQQLQILYKQTASCQKYVPRYYLAMSSIQHVNEVAVI